MDNDKISNATSRSRFSRSVAIVPKDPTSRHDLSYDYSILCKPVKPYAKKNDIKELIFNLKSQKKLEIDNFHTNFLKDKYSSSKYFFLTDQKDIPSRNSFNDQPALVPEVYKYSKRGEQEIPRDLLSNLMDKESIKDFIRKARVSGVQKHALKIKEEKTKRFKEIYNNAIEEITDKNTNLLEIKDLFTKQFLVSFEDYMRSLEILKEKQRVQLNRLTEQAIKLENETKNKKIQMNRAVEKLLNYKQYRNFLLCVKEKVPRVELTSKYKEKEQKLKRRKTVKLIEHKVDRNEASTNILNESNFSDDTVFERSSELWEHLEVLEGKNIILMDKLIKQKGNATKHERNFEELRVSEAEKNDEMEQKIAEVQHNLQNLRDKNARMKNEKRKLLHVESSDKDQYLNFIYKKSKELLNVLKLTTTVEKVNFQGKENMAKDIFSILKCLEKKFNELDDDYQKLMKKNPMKTKEAEKTLETQKKYKNAREKIEKEAELLAIKHQEIIENGQKFYVLPKKPVVGMTMVKSRTKRKFVTQKKNEIDFDDLIEYTSVEDD